MKIVYWVDGTWCYKDDYSIREYGWKSDDFGILDVSEDTPEEHISVLVDQLLS